MLDAFGWFCGLLPTTTSTSRITDKVNMSRPRRNVQSKSYVTASSEDESNPKTEGSAFDSDSEVSPVRGGPKKIVSDLNSDFNEEPSAINNTPVFSAPLTASQIQQTRALITEQAAQLQELLTQHEQYQTLAQEFEKKVQQCEKDLFENRAKLAPISRVPPEILGVILVIHVQENGGSPWLPMQVSRAWRATALLTRRIWSGILLVAATEPKEWISGAADGREICATEPKLIRALNRAGNAALDLKIVASFEISHTPIKQKEDLCKLLDVIKTRQQIPRIRSIELDTAYSFTFPKDSFDAFSFAPMESLKLDAKYSEIALKVIKESTHLSRLSIPLGHAGALRQFQGWNQVEELEITSAGLDENNHVDLSLLLSRVANLSSLDLHHLQVQHGDDPLDGQEPELPSLKRLRLRYSSFRNTFWPVLCPKITHLLIGNIFGRTASFALDMGDGAIALPLLRELNCSTAGCSFGFLRVFQAPSLHKLILHDIDGKAVSAQGFKDLWPPQPRLSSANKASPSSIEPVVIHLQDFAVNSKLLGRILAERNTMTEFCMKGCPVTVQIFQALMPVHKPKGKGKKKGTWLVGCPKLKVLSIDFSENKMSDEAAASILESATALVAQRAKAGAPLERFSIRIYMVEPWRELVDVHNKV